MKRLEQGTYELPAARGDDTYLISHQQLLLVLEGISLNQIKFRKRYAHKTAFCE